MVVWLILIDGHCHLPLVNVICVDLFWLTFIRNFCSHFSMPVRWSCRFLDAVVGPESFANIAVSFTKVLITVFAMLVDQMYIVCIEGVQGCFLGERPNVLDVMLRFLY